MSKHSSVNPEVMFVDDMLKEAEQGMLKVPAFQRGYVWQKKQVIELLDSIYHGYPIGSVMLWATELKMRVNNVFNNSKSIETNNSYYIVDGQQRLTTLYHCLTSLNGDDHVWDVYADLKTDKFFHLNKNEDLKAHHFPLKKIRSTADFIKECTRLSKEENSNFLIEKAELLSDRLRKYKLSIIKMIGGNIEEAIEIFTRLNRTGLEILPFDIINALNYVDTGNSPFTDLRRRMKDYIEEDGFFNQEKDETLFESEIYLKLVRISSGFQLYDTKDTIKLSEFCKSKRFESKVEMMFQALKKTLNFLKDDLLIFRFSDLPYTNLFYMLYIHFFSFLEKDKSVNVKKLKINFYNSILTGLPNGSPSVTEKALKFFSSDFDTNVLTKKLTKDFQNQDYIEQFINGIANGNFSAASAQSKLLFNIITNKYYEIKNIDHDNGYLKYPPLNRYNDVNIKGRLGNKLFFVKSFEWGDDYIVYNDITGLSKEELISEREFALANLAEEFMLNLLDL